MSRRRISSGTPFEELASFSRAVVDGDMVYVSGTGGPFSVIGSTAPNLFGGTPAPARPGRIFPPRA